MNKEDFDKNINYKKICSEILSGLKDREKEIVSRRFALLGQEEQETLEAIGQDFDLSRERIRQIEAASLKKVQPKTENYPQVLDSLRRYFNEYGGLKREKTLLQEMGGAQANELYFFLTLEKSFQRKKETDEFYAFWVLDGREALDKVRGVIREALNKLKEEKEPVPLGDLEDLVYLSPKALASYLEVSKKIQNNDDGLYGLEDWPEINPKGVKDKAYLALKRAGEPLHFTKVAEKVSDAHLQTVHNELIKDDRFILVGRGIYALAEWGYYPGHVKDVIQKILKEADKPLSKEEIVRKVLRQRMIKKNTILLNLSSHDLFKQTSEGRYKIREA